MKKNWKIIAIKRHTGGVKRVSCILIHINYENSVASTGIKNGKNLFLKDSR